MTPKRYLTAGRLDGRATGLAKWSQPLGMIEGMIEGMIAAASLRFSAAARALADEARREGLAAPGFRSPPGVPGATRTLRRLAPGGAVVAVTIRDRPGADVIADMIEGVVAANGLTGPSADRVRSRLESRLADRLTWAA